MGSISTREHIRWGTDPASEPTSTLVLTSPGRHFVDIRILKTALPNKGFNHASLLPRSSIDWAFGGTSSSSLISPNKSRAVFKHWVDSRSKDPEKEIVDEGDMVPHPTDRNLTVETGKMVNPATGIETEYEEVWRDEEVAEAARLLVLRLHDDDSGKRGMFVRLGRYAQGVLRVGNSFTAERWEMDEKDERQWKRLFEAGDEGVDSLDGILERIDKIHRVGDELRLDGGVGGKWTVIEANA